MPWTCCCGCCKLSSATIFAVLICLAECVFGLFWNVQLWLLLNRGNSVEFLMDYVNIDHLDDFDVVHGLSLASTGLHILWIIFSIMAIRANSTLNRGLMTPWVFFTYLQTAFDIGCTIYFSTKFQGCYMSVQYFWSDGPTPTLTYLSLTILFSRGVLCWFFNVYLAFLVDKRGKEIEDNNSMLALYILSHLAPRPGSGQEARPPPLDLPPAYCHPSYLPKYLMGRARESLESSWSLNQEALQGINSYQNPMYPRIAHHSMSDLRQVSNNSSLNAQYGLVPSVENSVRYPEANGVFPQ